MNQIAMTMINTADLVPWGGYTVPEESGIQGSGAAEKWRLEKLRLCREVEELTFLAGFSREVSSTLELETTLCMMARSLYRHFRFDQLEFAFSPSFGGTSTIYCAVDEQGIVPRLPIHGGEWAPRVKGYRSLGLSEPKARGWKGSDIHIRLPGEAGVIVLYSASRARGESDKFLTSIGEIICDALKNAKAYGAMKELSQRDSLTGLFNRRVLEELLGLEIARRDPVPLALMMLDLDDFKSVNDTFGHPAGDLVLTTFGAILRNCCRTSDVVARCGGEEFAVLLPDTSGTAAVKVAERLCRKVAEQSFTFAGRQIRVTASIGVAIRTDGEVSADELRMRADQALYQAKKSGKNRVSVFTSGKARSKGWKIVRPCAPVTDMGYATIAA
jgi:two-component system cell cycle response regulator